MSIQPYGASLPENNRADEDPKKELAKPDPKGLEKKGTPIDTTPKVSQKGMSTFTDSQTRAF